ncbi:MAG: tetratricopeptide repeat protein [Acidobacteria bacterium]|nr:tetratricopeptide repeat protein [Acidobacteriota bacterium]
MIRQAWAAFLIAVLGISISAVAQTPSAAVNLLRRGNAALAKGDWEHALADFTRAIQINSHIDDTENLELAGMEDCAPQIVVNDDFNACVYSNRGIAHYRLGNLEHSIADFDRAIRISPRLADAYNNRGNVWQAKGNSENALLDFDRAIQLNPRHHQAFNNRANLRLANHDLSGAISDYSRSIELDATNATVFANRGLTLLQLGRNEEARLDFEQAIKLAPHLKPKLEELIRQEQKLNQDSNPTYSKGNL